MSNETPTWMAVLEAVKAKTENQWSTPRSFKATANAEHRHEFATDRAADAWRDDTSQGPEGYPMPDEPGTIAAMTPFQKEIYAKVGALNAEWEAEARDRHPRK